MKDEVGKLQITGDSATQPTSSGTTDKTNYQPTEATQRGALPKPVEPPSAVVEANKVISDGTIDNTLEFCLF